MSESEELEVSFARVHEYTGKASGVGEGRRAGGGVSVPEDLLQWSYAFCVELTNWLVFRGSACVT